MTIQQTFIGLQIKEPTMQLKTLLTLPLLLTLASPALADADKALLAKCDMDRNGVINGPANDLPPAAWAMVEKELVCQREYEIDQLAKAVPDIRKRCDLNGNGRIDHAQPLVTPILTAGKETNARKAWRSLPEAVRNQVRVEQNCVMDAESARLDAELAKGKAELAKVQNEADQLIEILAMLDAGEAKAYLKDEIQKAETNLAKAKENEDQRRAKSIEYRLNRLRSHQQKLK